MVEIRPLGHDAATGKQRYFETGDTISGVLASSNGISDLRDDFVNGWQVGSTLFSTFYRGENISGSTGLASTGSPVGTNTTDITIGEVAISVASSSSPDAYGWTIGTPLIIGAGIVTVEWRLKQDSLLDAGSDFINWGVGLFTSLPSIANSTSAANAIYFLALNGNQAYNTVTANGGTVTNNTFTGNGDNTNWNRFKIIINAAATSVGFYYNGTLVNTHTTNIPSTGSTYKNAFATRKMAGTGTRTTYLDYANINTAFTGTR